MVPPPVHREEREPHTLGFIPGFASHLLGALNKSHKITGASPSSVCRLIACGKCCVQISRAIESYVLSHLLFFFPLFFFFCFFFFSFFKNMRCPFYMQLICTYPNLSMALQLHFKIISYKHIHDI